MTVRRFAPVLAVFFLFVAASFDRAAAQFKDETTVVVIEVPVHVIRDGAPVRGLTADDFVVLDGRKKQDLIGFEVVDLGEYGTQSEQKEVTRITASGRRHFLLLFDLSLSEPESVQRARQSARQLMMHSLHPADLVGVATYTEARGAEMVLNFTPNRDQVEVALRTLGLAEPAASIVDPLSLIIGDLAAEQGAEEGGGGGRTDAASMALENARDLKTLTGRISRDQQRSRVLALTESMRNLAGLMNSVEGRKHVVFLSEGFDSQILTGVDDMGRQQEINRAIESGDVWQVDSQERYGDSQATSALEAMLEEFRRSDCAIQAVDIGGLDAGPDANTRGSRNEGLFRMARETGGEFYQNYNEVDKAMGEVLDRTSVTYLLAFQPKDLQFDGKFHKIKVELKDNVKGTRLVHRPGYYPPKPFEQLSAAERQLSTASAVVAGTEGGQFLTSVISGAFPAPGEQSYVPVLVEVDGKSMIAGYDKDTLVAEIYSYALDEEGQVADFFVRRLGLNMASARNVLMANGLKYWGHLDLGPGQYAVRTLVRNAVTGESSLSVTSLSVPDRAAGGGQLLPPFFPEAPNKWLLARETEEEQRADVGFPFLMGDQPFLPAAKPILANGDQTIVLAGYDLGEGALKLSTQLYTPEGEVIEGGDIELLERYPAGAGFERLTARFSPGKLPRGEYLLMVTVTDLAGGAEHTSSTKVVVGG